jgi:hypothetical protein
MALLAIAASLVVPALDRRTTSCPGLPAQDLIGLGEAVERYAAREGEFPVTLDVLVQPDARGRRCLPRLAVPTDPWRRPYLY